MDRLEFIVEVYNERGQIFQLQTLYSEKEAIYFAKCSASEVSSRKYNVYVKSA